MFNDNIFIYYIVIIVCKCWKFVVSWMCVISYISLGMLDECFYMLIYIDKLVDIL